MSHDLCFTVIGQISKERLASDEELLGEHFEIILFVFKSFTGHINIITKL